MFFNLASADTNDALLAIEREIGPKLAAHNQRILQNDALFQRIDALHRARDTAGLTAEQKRVLDRYHKMYKRAGAGLDATTKKRLAEIAERLAVLGTSFSQNVLADEQGYTLTLESEDDLAGLPDFVRAAARSAAAERGMEGKHVITLSRSSVEPFLQFSSRRDLREKAFRAWIARGDQGGATDNKAAIAETVALRAERAKLLGFETFAHYRLDDAMAKTPDAVRDLLDRVWAPARAGALADRDAMQELVRRGGRQLHHRAVGLALLRREAAQGPLRHRRGDGEALLPAPPHHRCGVLHRLQAVRPHLRAPQGRRHLASRRDDLGGAGAGRPPSRPVLRRLFRAAVKAHRAPG